MGRNFYLYFNRKKGEEGTEEFHIGKRSAGWVFHFQAHARPNIRTVEEMRKYTKLGFIYDEYGIEHTYEDFWKAVERTKENFNGEPPYVLTDPSEEPQSSFSEDELWEDEGFAFSSWDFS